MKKIVLYSEEQSLQEDKSGQAINELLNLTKSKEVEFSVALWRKNIGRIPEVIRWLKAQTGLSIPEVERWNPLEIGNIADSLVEYFRYLKTVVEPNGVKIEPPEQELFEMCKTLDQSSEISTSDKLRILGIATESVFIGPRVFHLDITNDCNTNCLYCWFHSPLSLKRIDADLLDEKWKKTYLDLDIAKLLIKDLARLGTKEDLVLSGKGEPVLHPNVVEVIKEAKQRDIFVTLFCNGVELDANLQDAIIENQVDLLYISVSSATYRTYIKLHPRRPKDEFGRIVKNVAEFVGKKKRLGVKRPQAVWVMVICYPNAHEVLKFYELGKALGVDLVRFQLMAAEPYNRKIAIRKEQFASVIEQIRLAKKIERSGGPKIVENIDVQIKQLETGNMDWTKGYFDTHPCAVGWVFSRSWAGGEIAFCCSPKVIANLKDISFYDLWHSEKYRYYRRAAKYIQSHKNVKFENAVLLYNEHCHRCPNYEQITFIEEITKKIKMERFLKE